MEEAIELWNEGKSDEEVSALLAGKIIRDDGIVESVSGPNTMIDECYVEVTLREFRYAFSDGRKGVVDTVAIYFPPEEESWNGVHPGSDVRFEAVVDKWDGNYFPPVRWCDYIDDGSIDIHTHGRRLGDSIETNAVESVTRIGPAPGDSDVEELVLGNTDSLTDYEHCWNGSQPGWRLRFYKKRRCEFTFTKRDGKPLTNEEKDRLQDIVDSYPTALQWPGSPVEVKLDTVITKIIADHEAESLRAQVQSAGFVVDSTVKGFWQEAVPVSPDGTELRLEDSEVQGEIAEQMLSAGVDVEEIDSPW